MALPHFKWRTGLGKKTSPVTHLHCLLQGHKARPVTRPHLGVILGAEGCPRASGSQIGPRGSWPTQTRCCERPSCFALCSQTGKTSSHWGEGWTHFSRTKKCQPVTVGRHMWGRQALP